MNKLLFFVLIVLVSVALIGGLMVVGGPGYARMEKKDKERLQDLRRFAEFKTCELTISSQSKDCDGLVGAQNPVDPETGEAFSFKSISDSQFKVCSLFQTDPKDLPTYTNSQLDVTDQTGCFTYRRDAASGRWLRR